MFMFRIRAIVCGLLVLQATAVGLSAAALAAEADRADPELERSAILAKPAITLADLQRLAELDNPSLAAARNAAEARAGQARQAGLYPNPTLEFGVEEALVSAPEFRKDKVALIVPLVLSGRRGEAATAARAGQSAAGHDLELLRRDVFRRVQNLRAEHLYYREAGVAFTELIEVAQHTLDIAETRFEARAAPEAQVTRALLEVYDLEVAQQRLESEQIRAAAELAALLGGTLIPGDRLAGSLDEAMLGTPLAVPSDQGDLDVDLYVEQHIDQHPAVLSAEMKVDAAAATLRLAKTSRLPDVDLLLAYGKYRPFDEGFFEVAISLPLPIFNRNQGDVAAGHSLVAQAEYQARVVESQLAVAVATARAQYRTTGDQLDMVVDRIAPAAERGLIQAQEGYRVGRLAFLELLDAQRVLSTVRLRSLELKRDLIIARAELTSLVGDDTGAGIEETGIGETSTGDM
jgi:cobalt-zinc-cadmium efflux system outer membrane protein